MAHDAADLDREAEQIVKDIGIPPCPAILTKLMQEMRSDEPDFVRLGKLIGGDVSLAAAMLKMVNSPFYGLRKKATSVQQALALLGLRNVAQLVTGLLLRDAFPGGTSDAMDDYWESSSAIADINAGLARRFRCGDRDEAYTFALFRDCGILAMMGHFKNYKPVLAGGRGEGGEWVTDSEVELHGVHHAHVGHRLARTWLLAEDVCQAVLWHHEYEAVQDGRAGVSPAGARHIACALAAEWLFVKSTMGKNSAEWRCGGPFALQQLGIVQADLDAIAVEMHDEAANAGA